MVLVLGKRNSSSKCKCQALENVYDKAKNAWHIKYNKAQLFGIYLTLL